MIKMLSVVLVTAAGLAAQAVPVCMAVTVDQARKLIGESAKRSKDPSGCQWGGDKGQLDVMRVGVASMFERARAGSAAKGKVQSENGLGGTAFSTIPTAEHGGRAAIYVLKGDAILVVDITGFPAGGAEAALPLLRDLARDLLPKL
jgi:hypothetical protein